MASSWVPYHKLVVMGGGGVGKTALVIQLCLNEFPETYDPTIEESYRKSMRVDQQLCVVEILDTAGQEEYSAMREYYMKGGEAFILVYSVTSRQSFKEAATFYQQVMNVRGARAGGTPDASSVSNAPIIYLVGNKSDQSTEREVSTREGFGLARDLGCMFIEASAKERRNVEQAFVTLVRLLREQRRLNHFNERASIEQAIEEFRRTGPLPQKSRRSIPQRLSVSSFFSSRANASLSRDSSPTPLTALQQAKVDQLLVQAARRDKQSTVKELLALGAHPDGTSEADGSALYAAVAAGHLDMAKLLLKSKASVNAVGLSDQCPLLAASIEGYAPLIEFLLDKGANIEAKCEMYGTPLLGAVSRGRVEAVRTLIARRANVNATGGLYGNALQAVAWTGNMKIAELLLDAGANPHARGEGNCTALQVASAAGHYEIVRLLLLRRADVRDSRGRFGSPLHAAHTYSHFNVITLLHEFGAREDELEQMGTVTEAEEPGTEQHDDNGIVRDVETASPDVPQPQDGLHHVYPSRLRSHEWIDRLVESDCNRDLALSYSTKQPNGNVPRRTSVAILDTGYDSESVFFTRPRLQRLKGWKDWVEHRKQPCDEGGHGTSVLSVLMKVAPYADVYVARVARSEEDLLNASDNIAKAILWAVTEWQVDIVSMSFGFQSEILVNDVPVISNAILEAIQRRQGFILFFAAAANYGGNTKEMFPARHQFVVPVRGTNSNGVFQDFNPPPDHHGPVVYGTLGVEIPSAGLSTQGSLVYRSGTSVATPVAAGVAALVLSCASTSFGDRASLANDPVKYLWSNKGILSMFSQMSTYMDGRCLYLNPGSFMQKTEAERRATLIVAAADTAV